MSKPLSIRTTIERALNINISSSLPAKDKVAVMECLLTLSANDIRRINESDKAIAFVSLCANILRRGELMEYMHILEMCRKMALNNDKCV
uniref:hypothetical protein n=1 Tax=Prevotella sp. TaxID=59823 RepID=UPI004026092F